MVSKTYQVVYDWYSRESVQKALLEFGRNREVVVVFGNKQFGKRPNVLQYPGDILQAVSEGAVAFHGSVERWSNPMNLDVGMTQEQLNSLRIGWDLLIDIDVSDFEVAKIATRCFVEALKDHGIKNFFVKFTGGKSFHIFLPFESFPQKINTVPTKEQYPEVAKKVTEYLKWYVEDDLKDSLLKRFDVKEISQRVGKSVEEISEDGELLPFKAITIDIFGSRHLFRLPYSLHESTLLVSVPLKEERVERFKKEYADPEKIDVDFAFLEKRAEFPEAEALVIEALDWASALSEEEEKVLPKEARRKRVKPGKPVPEEFFPPCIKAILSGLSDGRKRSVFTLVNFLRHMNWSFEEIEKRVFEWNEANKPPLRENYVKAQLRWNFRQERDLLPANCDHSLFYEDIGICKPDEVCEGKKVKNPINYPFKLLKVRRGRKKWKRR